MDKKYFRPKIESLYVGYEGYYRNISMDEIGDPELNYDRIEKTILSGHQLQSALKYGSTLMTAYLSEDILIEDGWEQQEESSAYGNPIFKKGNFWLIYYRPDSYFEYPVVNIIAIDPTKLQFTSYPENFRPMFPCPSINELRRFISLLDIK